MKIIGLLGGMSSEATITYYRLINEKIRAKLGGLNAADLVLRSVNFNDIVSMQLANKWTESGKYLSEAAQQIERAGAECVLICANTMHIVSEPVAAAISVPLINIIDETAKQLVKAAKKRPVLLATKYTMEHGFYQQSMARHDISVMVPDSEGRETVHRIIYEELCRGIITPDSREKLSALVVQAKHDGADSVIFGCTEIGLILDPNNLALPGFDSTIIHVDAAVDFALS